MRVLGVDYGVRAVGLAVADDATGVATPLSVIRVASTHDAPGAVAAVAREIQAGAVVVGAPEGLEGEEDRVELRRVRRFARSLRKALGVPVHLVDESMSTRESRERSSGSIADGEHAGAAAIILERWLRERARGGSK